MCFGVLSCFAMFHRCVVKGDGDLFGRSLKMWLVP